MKKKVRAFLKKVEQGLGEYRSAGMVVAVSGGADSVALLLAISRILDSNVPLIVGHFNHQLRGSEGDADQSFVEELCARLKHEGCSITFHSTSHDVQAEAKKTGENLERTARELRYRWLTELAVEQGANAVLTGHTADDQAETVLHRLIRGSGLRGLCGIAPERTWGESILVRPMLTVTRAEVELFLEALGQTAREDSTNTDLSFTRNRIRHELLPLLVESYNPAIGEILSRLAMQAHEIYQEEAHEACELLAQVERPRARSVVILDHSALSGLSSMQKRAVLRQVWQREGWPQNGMGFEQWKRLESLIDEELSSVDLPGKLRARRWGELLQIGRIVDLARI